MFPNQVLRKTTSEITKVDQKLLGEIKTLSKILMAAENGAGLAALQIGVSKKFLGLKENGKMRILVNPKMSGFYGEKIFPKIREEKGGESDFLEGCMSFPDLFGTVKRYLKIKANWQEIVEGKLENREGILEGFGAIVFQHELDHLEGILFVDHVKEDKGKLYLWKDEEKIAVKVEEILGKEK